MKIKRLYLHDNKKLTFYLPIFRTKYFLVQPTPQMRK